MAQTIKVLSIEHLTHDVLHIIAEKPSGYNFVAGQAADVSINKQGWEQELRAFTFTSLPEEDNLEFVIKTYPSHNGVTNQLNSLNVGDELLLHDPFGDIHYKGKGVFIAGGAGITPFIAIFKQLEKANKIGSNKLIFANKTKADIIHENKFAKLLGSNFINVLSDEKLPDYEHGYISAELIKKYSDVSSRYFYLCGPPAMMEAVELYLIALGVDADHVVKEAF